MFLLRIELRSQESKSCVLTDYTIETLYIKYNISLKHYLNFFIVFCYLNNIIFSIYNNIL